MEQLHYTRDELKDLDRIFRLNLVNSVTGIKPANLIGTYSSEYGTNLAIFSSVVHLGSNPPLIGFVVRPGGEVRRHTYENILETRQYTINHVHPSFIENAHYTSIKFDKEVSEFGSCGFSEEYLNGFEPPFVKQSNLKIGMELIEEIPIKLNGTVLIVGQIVHLVIPAVACDEFGHLDLTSTESVGISGLNSYYDFKKLDQFPYARISGLPDFKYPDE